MGVVVEPCHENYAVNAHPPFLFEHFLGFFPENSRGSTFVSCCLPLSKLLTLWEGNSDETDSNTQASGNPEDSLERLGFTTDSEIGARSADISEIRSA